MARLIDADVLKSFLLDIESTTKDKKVNDTVNLVLHDAMIKFIDEQPTAYNIDKVVESLEENSVMRANSKTFYDNPQKGEYVDEVVLLNKAIEIVKAGGVNEI